MKERPAAVTMKGSPLTLIGEEPKVGQPAPDFEAVANDLSRVTLSSLLGKPVLIAAVPSLDTPVCDLETRRFNQEAVKIGGDLVVLTLSMDLPFAQARWCGAAGVKNVRTLSDHRDGAFGTAYGVLIKGIRLLARAVYVVDRKGVLRYAQVVPDITQEPNYDRALAAVREVS